MRFRILEVPIDAISKDEARRRVVGFFDGISAKLITTPNPEMIVAARRDGAFLEALKAADLALADGFGLRLGAAVAGVSLRGRITGSDFLMDIVRLAAEHGARVCLLGGFDSVGERAAAFLRVAVPKADIVAIPCGRVEERGGQIVADSAAVARIEGAAPTVVFVAFGHGKQERWMHAHRDRFPSVRVMMGVGGAFDFLAGRIRRAPPILRAIGLEWAWRLLMEPRRLPRILNAVVVFPWLVLADAVKRRSQ